uniref:Uncharacterized protein n=1 Tax=Nelumbo nucifera TaxID=4432 RepID=A0A822YZ60_NELNU|nr:TPA_asm: hypothetical protein HUJ06_007180 [Nelumbo nucifera]
MIKILEWRDITAWQVDCDTRGLVLQFIFFFRLVELHFNYRIEQKFKFSETQEGMQ